MNIRKTAVLLTLGMATLAGSLASQSALAAKGVVAQPYNIEQTFVVDVQNMTDKTGMVSKKQFMDMMSKKFDAMDKGRHGMLSVAEIMRIFSDTTGQ
ncbi:MAG: hypothetical protein ACM3QY_08605 [Candidatus Levyibacteriota bacterium]